MRGTLLAFSLAWIPLPLAAQNANVVANAGYLYPAPILVAPGQVISLFVANSGTGDYTVTVQQGQAYEAPVLAVGTTSSCAGNPGVCTAITALTVEIPTEIRPPCVSGAVCNALAVATNVYVTQNGVAGPAFSVTPLSDHIHILGTCDTVVSGSGIAPVNGLPCAPLVTHADGSLVSASNPAAGNEELVAYAAGLGATNPPVATGQAASEAVPTANSFMLSFDWIPDALPAQPYYPAGVALTTYAYPRFTGLVPGYVGLYQINFVVPPPGAIPACGGAVQSNLTVNIGGPSSFDGAGICVIPGF